MEVELFVPLVQSYRVYPLKETNWAFRCLRSGSNDEQKHRAIFSLALQTTNSCTNLITITKFIICRRKSVAEFGRRKASSWRTLRVPTASQHGYALAMSIDVEHTGHSRSGCKTLPLFSGRFQWRSRFIVAWEWNRLFRWFPSMYWAARSEITVKGPRKLRQKVNNDLGHLG